MLDVLSGTMLLERLVGVGTYALLLMITYFSIKHAEDRREINRVFNMCLIALVIMAYYYIPANTADLARWWSISDGWKDRPFGEFYERYKDVTSPVAYLYIYLCAQTDIKGILPAVTAFIYYYNIFYIFKDLYSKHNTNSQTLAICFLFFMAKGCFLEVISGVRCFMALAILARCFYDELFNNISIIKNIIWEILAALIHPMAVILLAVRILFMLFQKSDSFFKKIFTSSLAVILAFIAYQYNGGIFDSAVNKAEDYATGTEVYSYGWEYLIAGILLFLFISIISKNRKLKDNSIEFGNITLFNAVLIAINVGVIFEYNMFHRLATFNTMIILPILAKCINNDMDSRFILFIKWMSLIIFLIACARGNLCGYKFLLFQ